MADNTRRDAATATTGAALLGVGGVMRHHAVRRSYPDPRRQPKIHALAMLRRAPRGKKQFWVGSTIGALGLPPLAVGTTRLVRGDVDKADDRRPGFWREGLSGTGDALRQRAQSYQDPVPIKFRAAQAGVGAGVGALGSLAARAALGRRGNALKPLLTPVAGGLAATASVPLSNKAVQRRHPEYEITAAGVRRKKAAIKMPSSKATPHRSTGRNFRRDVEKSALDDARSQPYQGSRTPYIRQRAAITAAGHPPVVGPFTAAAAAARYAPPGQGRKQATRQWAMGSGAGFPIGVGGAYVGAHLTSRSSTAEGIANDALKVKRSVHTAARRAVGLKEKAPKGPGKLTRRFLSSGAGKPFRTKAGAVGGAAGFIGAKAASGGVLGQTAITLNQRDQRRYNAAHDIKKAAGPGQTRRERHQLASRKRTSAALSTVSGAAGLGSLVLLATGHRHPAVTLGTAGAGVGGTNSLLGARVQRQEARAVDPLSKRMPRSQLEAAANWHAGLHRISENLVAVPKARPHRRLAAEVLRSLAVDPTPLLQIPRVAIRKAGPLEVKDNPREHRELLRRYGDRGPLPKGLDRDTRMRTWEARYVHHGGQKQNHYSRLAAVGSGVKNAGLGVATVGGAAWLSTRGKSGAAVAAKHPRLRHQAETVAGAGATVGGAGEMMAGWAHHRQSSYANSPGGVAASALRRMRANTPEDSP